MYITHAQREALWACKQGNPFRGCHGLAAHGGRTVSLACLARRGLVNIPQIASGTLMHDATPSAYGIEVLNNYDLQESACQLIRR